jgi:hypothetical protein
MSQTFIGYPIITSAGVQIATSGSSARSAIPNDSAGNVPRYVRLSATAAACIRLGISTVTAANTDTQVQPGDSLVLAIPSGMTHIAAIQQSGAGVVQISPLENA